MKIQDIIRKRLGIAPGKAQQQIDREADPRKHCPLCSYPLLRIGRTYLCSSCRLPVAPSPS